MVSEKKENKHIVFVGSEEEKKNFSVGDYFGSEKELVKRKHNRLRSEQLENESLVQGAVESKKQVELVSKLNKKKYDELEERTKRKEDITKVLEELETRSKLMVSSFFFFCFD